MMSTAQSMKTRSRQQHTKENGEILKRGLDSSGSSEVDCNLNNSRQKLEAPPAEKKIGMSDEDWDKFYEKNPTQVMGTARGYYYQIFKLATALEVAIICV